MRIPHRRCMLAVIVAIVATTSALAQTPFRDAVYDVAVTTDVVYGAAAVGAPQPGTKELLLDLYEPVGEGAPALRPALLAIHGGGFRGGDKAQGNFVALCRDLAARGYVCASINYRLEGDDPPTEGETSQARAIAAAITDAGTALMWLHGRADEHHVDRSRIAVGGGSAGAITTLFLVYQFGDPHYPVRAVLDLWGGLYDSVDAIEAGEPPLVIIHGTDDHTVPFSLAEAIVRRAEAVGVPHELYAIQGAGHALPLSTQLDGVPLYDHIAAFFYDHMNLAELAGGHLSAGTRPGPIGRRVPGNSDPKGR